MIASQFPALRYAKVHLRTAAVSTSLQIKSILIDYDVLFDEHGLKTAVETLSRPTGMTYDTSREIENISTIQTKYMKKLRDRLGGQVSFVAKDGKTKSCKTSEAKLIQETKSIKAANNNEFEGVREGMIDILRYFSARAIALGLLSQRSQIDTAKAFTGQLLKSNNIRFEYVGTMTMQGLEPSHEIGRGRNTLVISQNPLTLELAERQGFKICRFESSDPQSASQSGATVRTNYTARKAIDIQDAVEDMNGISMTSAHLRLVGIENL